MDEDTVHDTSERDAEMADTKALMDESFATKRAAEEVQHERLWRQFEKRQRV